MKFSKVELLSNPASLIRASIWVLFFLGLIGIALPPFKAKKSGSKLPNDMVDMTLGFGDPRGFSELDVAKSNSELRIAWISGSSTRSKVFEKAKTKGRRKIKRWEYIPHEVNKRISATTAHDPTTLLYLFRAQRLYEIFVCVQSAIKHNPDVIVVTLNPAFVYNARAFFFRDYLLGKAGTLLPLRGRSILNYLMISEPGDWIKAVFLGFSPIAEEQAHLNRKYFQIVGYLHPLKRKSGEIDRSLKAGFKKNNPFPYTQSIQFWNDRLRHHFNLLNKHAYGSGIIDYIGEAEKNMNDKILDDIFESLKSINVPSIVYLAPLSPKIKKRAEFKLGIRKLEEMLKMKEENYSSSALRIIPVIPPEYMKSSRFRDAVHLADFGDIPVFLSNEILNLVKQ